MLSRFWGIGNATIDIHIMHGTGRLLVLIHDWKDTAMQKAHRCLSFGQVSQKYTLGQLIYVPSVRPYDFWTNGLRFTSQVQKSINLGNSFRH